MTISLPSQVRDTRKRTLQLIAGLDDKQMMGPRMATINPLRWEIGHTAYFYEYWILRHHLGEPPLLRQADALFDSISIAHDERWDLPLPEIPDVLAYMQAVENRVCEHLDNAPADPARDYLTQYAVYHEDMHTEAFTYTRQTLGYPPPVLDTLAPATDSGAGLAGDADIPGGSFMLGAPPDSGFVFDNEKWAHHCEVAPFRIARAAVSNREFAAFVDAGGYANRHYWGDDGWTWRTQTGLEHPVYWRRDGDGWQQRRFDIWYPLPPHAAVVHVNWHEAQAYCRWAGRRLPTELEWEVAAAGQPTSDGKGLAETKRYFPWGETAPTAELANLDGYALGTIDVGALPGSDSAFGCRQMIGNVWEWTDTTFGPYPGFTPDMYADYSQPLFGQTKVLRGGAWPTRGRMIRNTWRSYYGPDRNDVFAGFRTCAV